MEWAAGRCCEIGLVGAQIESGRECVVRWVGWIGYGVASLRFAMHGAACCLVQILGVGIRDSYLVPLRRWRWDFFLLGLSAGFI